MQLLLLKVDISLSQPNTVAMRTRASPCNDALLYSPEPVKTVNGHTAHHAARRSDVHNVNGAPRHAVRSPRCLHAKAGSLIRRSRAVMLRPYACKAGNSAARSEACAVLPDRVLHHQCGADRVEQVPAQRTTLSVRVVQQRDAGERAAGIEATVEHHRFELTAEAILEAARGLTVRVGSVEGRVLLLAFEPSAHVALERGDQLGIGLPFFQAGAQSSLSAVSPKHEAGVGARVLQQLRNPRGRARPADAREQASFPVAEALTSTRTSASERSAASRTPVVMVEPDALGLAYQALVLRAERQVCGRPCVTAQCSSAYIV